jgi:hypothetical protein
MIDVSEELTASIIALVVGSLSLQCLFERDDGGSKLH